MARWIRLYESLLDDGLWQLLPGEQAKALIGLLLQVNWQPSEFGCRQCHKIMQLPPGATARSYRTLAERARVSEGCMKRLIANLTKKGFLKNASRPRCHTVYVVKNWEKYQTAEEAPDPGVAPGERPSLERPRRGPRRGPMNKNTRIEETESDTPQLPGLSPEKPLADAVSTADHLRAALVATGLPCPGYKTDTGYRARRKDWAERIQGASGDLGMSHQTIRELITWAMAAPAWEVGGQRWTWARVLATGEPHRKLAEKLPTLENMRQQKKEERHRALRIVRTPYPGFTHEAYYDGDREIDAKEYRRLKEQNP
jgi:hypothetical protein